jgi:hypothetical protein
VQAHWRGYCVRKRWNSSEASREQLVQELHDSLAAPITQARRLHEMKALLAARQQRLLERAAAAGAEPEDIHDGSREQPLAIGALMSREDLVPLGASTSMLSSLPIGRPGMNAGGVDWRRNGLGCGESSLPLEGAHVPLCCALDGRKSTALVDKQAVVMPD